MFFVLLFKIPCAIHQPILVADFGLRINHVKRFISLCLKKKNSIFFFFFLEKGGVAPAPLGMCARITAYTR
jgi:hypothetical protein